MGKGDGSSPKGREPLFTLAFVGSYSKYVSVYRRMYACRLYSLLFAASYGFIDAIANFGRHLADGHPSFWE